MHVPNHSGKPEVPFKTPTYFKGGSDCSFARQGGFISAVRSGAFTTHRFLRRAGRAFMAEIMFLRENIDKGFDYRLRLLSRMIKYAGKIHARHIFPLVS